MRTKTLLAAFAIGLIAVGVAACGSSSSNDTSSAASDTGTPAVSGDATSTEAPAPSLSGSVAVDGSSTVGPLSSAIAEDFQKASSGVQVTVGVSGTGGGIEKFCKGEIDIADASRAIKDEEKTACASAGVEFTELKVGLDGITNVVNASNTFATCLTVDQLKKVWDQGSTVKSWKEIDPSFPDEPIKLYGPGTASGTFEFFTEKVNGVKKQSRSDYTASEDDNVLVQGVAGDQGGLGYFGYGYFEANQDKLRALEVDGGAGCVAPTADTIRDGSYKPLARPLFIYVSKKAAARPEVKGFVDFYLAQAPTVIKDVQMVPLASYDETTAAWTAAAG